MASSTSSGIGASYYGVQAIDKADNVAVDKSSGFRFIYRFIGFLVPLNQQAGTYGVASIFAVGSVVPVRFQLVDCRGNFAINASAQIKLKKLGNSAGPATTIKEGTREPPDAGNRFNMRFVSLFGRQKTLVYEFRLDTGPLSEGIWQIEATLDDGTSWMINIGLQAGE